MQNSVITQCPNCEERFKVTPGQLKLAHGKVRCGECLTIFDALACAEDKPDTAPSYPEVDRRKPQQPQQPLDLQPAVPPPISIPVAEPVSTPAPIPMPVPEPVPKPAPVVAPEPVAIPEPVRVPVPEPAPAIEPAPVTAPLQTPVPETTATFSSGLTAERDEPPVRSKAKTAARYQTPLMDLKPEAVVMHISEDESDNPYNVTGWLLGTLVAIALLLFQVFWFERQTLSAYPELRPVYYLLCDHIDCTLRGPKAVNQIATRQLIIRPNPYFTGALSVSVVLENQSTFNQHFPLLRLMFNDTQGRHVAGRDFKPEEYLNTQRIDPRFMTPGQPFELTLELLAPATGTLGYQLDLLPYH
ncbi:DUF3426 domain-containing protein [Nitrincola sp. MINF-07-Sa-05]|uniref:DUF3426 domain-containing protein n=1 Tax=Nitrincola salilacus TaxID=3400273 RepID=UPI003917E7A3